MHVGGGKDDVATHGIDGETMLPNEFIVRMEEKVHFVPGGGDAGAVVATDRTRADDADSFKSPIRIVDFHGRIVYQS